MRATLATRFATVARQAAHRTVRNTPRTEKNACAKRNAHKLRPHATLIRQRHCTAHMRHTIGNHVAQVPSANNARARRYGLRPVRRQKHAAPSLPARKRACSRIAQLTSAAH